MSRSDHAKPFAKRSLGQNFLVDPSYINKIVSALDIQPGETIVEIGPGRGALTGRLVESPGYITALELDRALVPLLKEKFAGSSNIKIREADALEFDFEIQVSTGSKLKLVANLPYYISTAILQRLIEQRQVFSSMVLMFQREVVDRITAPRGDSERGFLTVLVEAFFSVEKLFDVPPTAFRPQPKVWSSVVRIIPKTSKVEDEIAFRELISSAFGQKRKTIMNNLKAKYPNATEMLTAADIDSKLRPEALTLDQWIRLATQTAK